jgi:exonuclease VII small subunit
VFGKSFEDMLKNLSAVFERMQTAGLKLKARKCKLFSTEVEYLSHANVTGALHRHYTKLI